MRTRPLCELRCRRFTPAPATGANHNLGPIAKASTKSAEIRCGVKSAPGGAELYRWLEDE